MINGTSPSESLLVMKVSEEIHASRFTHIDYIDSTIGWTCVNSVLFSIQRQRFSPHSSERLWTTPHPMRVTDFFAGMKRSERNADQLHLVSGLRIREINLLSSPYDFIASFLL